MSETTSQTVPYTIVIPAAKLTPQIMRETFGSPSYCPLATHLKGQGYKVLVGSDYILFFPINVPAAATHIGRAVIVSVDYKDTLHECSENEEDFHCTIQLPVELAISGSKYRK